MGSFWRKVPGIMGFVFRRPHNPLNTRKHAHSRPGTGQTTPPDAQTRANRLQGDYPTTENVGRKPVAPARQVGSKTGSLEDCLAILKALMIHTLEFRTSSPPGSYQDKHSNGRGGRYNGPALKTWQEEIQLAWQQAGRWVFPPTVPLYATVTVWIGRPANHLCADGTLKPSAPVYHRNTPDADNVGKATIDALTGLAWQDDRVFQDTHYRKRWSHDQLTRLRLVVSDEPLVEASHSRGEGADREI